VKTVMNLRVRNMTSTSRIAEKLSAPENDYSMDSLVSSLVGR